MSFTSYPEYKDSGIDWLGKVPKHWMPIPLAKIATDANSVFIDGDWIESKDLADEGIKYLTSGNVGVEKYKEQGSGFISSEKFNELQCTEVFPDDILISRLNLPLGRACLVPNLYSRIVTCVDNVIFRPNTDFSRKFLLYLLNSKNHFFNMENIGRGTTMPRVSRSLLGRVQFSFPLLAEQILIANFLDYETSKIDALIAEQEKLIELLKEKRQAVISHAVTKGLDPNVKMKDSGVEWLGQVPAHWEIKPLKVITSINDEVIPETTDPDFEICYVDIGSVSVTDGIKRTEQFKFSDAPSRARRIVRKGDIIVSTVRTYLKAITSIKKTISNMIVSTGFAVIRPKSNFLSDFASYSMQSGNFIDEVISRSTGVSYPAINASELGLIKVALPPIDEQAEISFFLIEKINAFDRLNVEANAAILILQERRSALISAAVTGQIDVRNVAITKEAA